MTPRERVAQFFSRDLRLNEALMEERVTQALSEDVGGGDLATGALVAEPVRGRAVIVAKADGVIAGLDVAAVCFRQVDAGVIVSSSHADGDAVRHGDEVLHVEGDLRSILVGERTALNFLRRMSGTATTTRAVVTAVSHTGVRVLDTRKTTPTLRMFDKYAVRAGGAWSHREGLYDLCLVKENHIAAAGGLQNALGLLTGMLDVHLVEVEVSTVADALLAADAGVPLILLDNMSVAVMTEAVHCINRLPDEQRPALEASGNITLRSAGVVAETGVDYLSMGGLTHSVPDLDLSLLVSAEGGVRG